MDAMLTIPRKLSEWIVLSTVVVSVLIGVGVGWVEWTARRGDEDS